jgi:hypothetical protein
MSVEVLSDSLGVISEGLFRVRWVGPKLRFFGLVVRLWTGVSSLGDVIFSMESRGGCQ